MVVDVHNEFLTIMFAQMLLYFLTTKEYSEFSVSSSKDPITGLYVGNIKNDLIPEKKIQVVHLPVCHFIFFKCVSCYYFDYTNLKWRWHWDTIQQLKHEKLLRIQGTHDIQL